MMTIDLIHRSLCLDSALTQDLWLADILLKERPSVPVIDEVFYLQRSVFIFLPGLFLNDFGIDFFRPNLLQPLDLFDRKLLVFY